MVVGFKPGRMPEDVDLVADPGPSILVDESPEAPVSYAGDDAVLRPKLMRPGAAYRFASKGLDLAAVSPDGDRLQIYWFSDKR
jgi:hypothetical protein